MFVAYLLGDESIDGYISLGVLEHFRSTVEVIKAFKECRRVLKRGGRALITISNIFVPLRNRLLLSIQRQNGHVSQSLHKNNLSPIGMDY
jgi:predicted SAM-dependent methyltransferase